MQPELDLTEGPTGARGPLSSELTLASLGKDQSLRMGIVRAVLAFERRGATSVIDDWIVEYLETVRKRRMQRNVIARERGRLEVNGWLQSMPPRPNAYGLDVHATASTDQLHRALGLGGL